MQRKILLDCAFRFYTYYGFSGRYNSKRYELNEIQKNEYNDYLEIDNLLIFNITRYKAETIAKKLCKYTMARKK